MSSELQVVLKIWSVYEPEGFPTWLYFPSSVCFDRSLHSVGVGIKTVNTSHLFCKLRFYMCVTFFQAHISSTNSELSNAALQALGFCVFNSKITSELPGKQTNFGVVVGSVYLCTTVLTLFPC